MPSTSCITHSGTLATILALLIGIVSTIAPTGQARAGQDYRLALPQIMKQAASTPPPDTPAQRALDRINGYRSLAGAQALEPHPALMAAAQNHATYYLLNAADASAMAAGPHGEVAGKPGYTSATAWDRAAAAGYPDLAGWEVMHFLDDPVASVDGWAATVFHRVILLDPYLAHMGYGHGRAGGVQVDVADFGHGTAAPDRQHVIVFPAPNQTDVPIFGAWESPSPLPPGETRPFGYPITLQPIAGVALMVTQAELRNSAGAPIAIYPNPPECGTACYALIQVAPLQPATTYTVQAAGTVDGAPFERAWSFTTLP